MIESQARGIHLIIYILPESIHTGSPGTPAFPGLPVSPGIPGFPGLP